MKKQISKELLSAMKAKLEDERHITFDDLNEFENELLDLGEGRIENGHTVQIVVSEYITSDDKTQAPQEEIEFGRTIVFNTEKINLETSYKAILLEMSEYLLQGQKVDITSNTDIDFGNDFWGTEIYPLGYL